MQGKGIAGCESTVEGLFPASSEILAQRIDHNDKHTAAIEEEEAYTRVMLVQILYNCMSGTLAW